MIPSEKIEALEYAPPHKLVEETKQGVGIAGNVCLVNCGNINAGDSNEGANANNKKHQPSKDEPLLQFFNLERVADSVYEPSHW